MAERDFKGIWIPAEIWLDDRLSAQEMVILAEIDSLDKGEDGCWASNDYLAKFSKCSSATVSRAIKNLISCGYIKIVSFDGRTRVMKSCLRKMTRQTNQNDKAAESKCRAITLEDNVTDKEKEIYKEKPTNHKHGEYQNVLLTDEDMEKLQAEFPSDWQTRIERLSEYMASTGKSYRNHLATIRNWARREKPKDENYDKPDFSIYDQGPVEVIHV